MLCCLSMDRFARSLRARMDSPHVPPYMWHRLHLQPLIGYYSGRQWTLELGALRAFSPQTLQARNSTQVQGIVRWLCATRSRVGVQFLLFTYTHHWTQTKGGSAGAPRSELRFPAHLSPEKQGLMNSEVDQHGLQLYNNVPIVIL